MEEPVQWLDCWQFIVMGAKSGALSGTPTLLTTDERLQLQAVDLLVPIPTLHSPHLESETCGNPAQSFPRLKKAQRAACAILVPSSQLPVITQMGEPELTSQDTKSDDQILTGSTVPRSGPSRTPQDVDPLLK